MKKCMTLIVSIVLFYMLPLPGHALALGGLSVDQSQLNFGTMKEGLVARKVVNLTNIGDTLIEIKNVRTS